MWCSLHGYELLTWNIIAQRIIPCVSLRRSAKGSLFTSGLKSRTVSLTPSVRLQTLSLIETQTVRLSSQTKGSSHDGMRGPALWPEEDLTSVALPQGDLVMRVQGLNDVCLIGRQWCHASAELGLHLRCSSKTDYFRFVRLVVNICKVNEQIQIDRLPRKRNTRTASVTSRDN